VRNSFAAQVTGQIMNPVNPFPMSQLLLQVPESSFVGVWVADSISKTVPSKSRAAVHVQ